MATIRPLIDDLRSVLALCENDPTGAPVPTVVPPPPKVKKAKTYDIAKTDILTYLGQNGWKVVTRNPSMQPMKVPHATSADGKLRLWFKTQAVYFTQGDRHEFGNARSVAYDLDIRKMEPAAFTSQISKWFK